MPSPEIVPGLPNRETAAPNPGGVPYRVAACVDTSVMARKVITHAIAITKALDAGLTLVRVLETPPTGERPPDPVDWEIRRREARDAVGRIAEEHMGTIEGIKAQVVEGQAAEQILIWARDHDVDLTIFSTHGEDTATGGRLGKTARAVIDGAVGSFLLVPLAVAADPAICFRRILVPLDGSCRAESVLPFAVQLARPHRGEIVLVHVVPIPELTEIGPLETEALELRERITVRNERVAHEYLDRVRHRLIDQGVTVRGVVLRDGDVRRRLARSVVDEAADLVVLSAHGRGGHADMPHGSVAAYQLAHAVTPLLIVNERPARSPRHLVPASDCGDLRLPEHASI